MDSIELGWMSRNLSDVAWDFAKSKCRATSFVDESTGHLQYPKKNSPYHQHSGFEYLGMPFHLQSRPKFYRQNRLPYFKATFHLSKFKSWEHFYSFAMELFSGMEEEFLAAKIHRLDTCIHIKLPFDTARKVFYVNNVRKCLMFQSPKRETVIFGSEPHQTVLYDRLPLDDTDIDWEPDDNDECDEENDIHFGGATYGPILVDRKAEEKTKTKARVLRLEVRHHIKSLPIRDIRSLYKLRSDEKLFQHIQLLELDEDLVSKLETKKERTVQAYLYVRDKSCAQMAKLKFAPSRTYANSIEPYLRPVRGINLQAAWEKRFDRWFGTEFGAEHETSR